MKKKVLKENYELNARRMMANEVDKRCAAVVGIEGIFEAPSKADERKKLSDGNQSVSSNLSFPFML